jgi:hypothetical protein
MLACAGILVTESYHPVGGKELDGLPAVFLGPWGSRQGLDFPLFWTALTIAAIVIESREMRGDLSDEEKRRKWDPGSFSKTEKELYDNKNTELAFGRIGMIGAIGIVVQELITGEPILSGMSTQ